MDRILRLAILILIVGSSTARADFQFFTGRDDNAGPTDPHPNSNAAAAQFLAAAGPTQLINFEDPSLVPGSPTSDGLPLTLASGVTLTTSGTNHDTSIFTFGVTNTPQTKGIGYNTTPGFSPGHYFWVQPAPNQSTASIVLHFDTPQKAFGMYITGLEVPLYVDILDTTHHEAIVAGYHGSSSSFGGAQYFGFTTDGPGVTQVTLTLRDLVPNFDSFGFDDIRLSAVPEPSSLLLFGVGGLGLWGAWRLRRRKNAAKLGGLVPESETR